MSLHTSFELYDLVFVALRKAGGRMRLIGPLTVECVMATQAAGEDQVTQYRVMNNQGEVFRVRERHVFRSVYQARQAYPGIELGPGLGVRA